MPRQVHREDAFPGQAPHLRRPGKMMPSRAVDQDHRRARGVARPMSEVIEPCCSWHARSLGYGPRADDVRSEMDSYQRVGSSSGRRWLITTLLLRATGY